MRLKIFRSSVLVLNTSFRDVSPESRKNGAKKSKNVQVLISIELIPNMPLLLEGGTSCNNNGMGAYEIVRVP